MTSAESPGLPLRDALGQQGVGSATGGAHGNELLDGELATERTRLRERLHQLHTMQQQRSNPELFELLPVGVCDLEALPEHLARRLFEALRLQVHYNKLRTGPVPASLKRPGCGGGSACAAGQREVLVGAASRPSGGSIIGWIGEAVVRWTCE